MQKYFLLVFCLFFSITIYSQTDKSKEIEILYHQPIPMRDGIALSGTIVKPKYTSEKLPVLFMLTPYIADLNQTSADFFAKQGYVVITVDTRGRGNSGGIAQPFTSQDGKDGFDVCKWLTEQPWCNGKIGMYGGSYLGMVQWLILKENPPGLKTIIPTASVCPGIDFPKRNNIFYTYVAPYLTFISGKTGNRTTFTDTEYWSQIYMYFFKGDLPYSKMLESSGIKSEEEMNWKTYTYGVLKVKIFKKGLNIHYLMIIGNQSSLQKRISNSLIFQYSQLQGITMMISLELCIIIPIL